MKEYVVSLRLLAQSNLEAQRLGESICSSFLSDRMCSVESIKQRRKPAKTLTADNIDDFDEYWLKSFESVDA